MSCPRICHDSETETTQYLHKGIGTWTEVPPWLLQLESVPHVLVLVQIMGIGFRIMMRKNIGRDNSSMLSKLDIFARNQLRRLYIVGTY